jgi:hypothetical protein
MMRYLAALALLGLVVGTALAQQVVTGTTQTAIPTCAVLGFNGTAFVCGTSGGGGVTVAGGQGIQVTGCPACVVAAFTPAITKTGSYTLATGDGTKVFVYNSALPGVFTFPVSGAVGFANGWGVCVIVRGTGSVSFATTAPSVFYGGPTTLGHSQSECLQADDTGNWLIFAGVSSAVANPNPF